MSKKIIFIVGPTAAGKTRIAIKLAKKINGEIISADSMQAYKFMAIISQRPAKAKQASVKHHLINFVNPEDEYSAAKFSELAGEKIRNIIDRGKNPIVVGGSGLYVKALIDGIFPSAGKDEMLREELKRLADEKGALFLYNKLKEIDPLSAERIHPNDLKRIIRALEIFEIEKRTKTSLKAETKGIKDIYDIRMFGLTMYRERLYKKINDRVDLMFKNGLVKELKALLGKNLSITAKQALGIKEIGSYIKGDCSLETVKDTLKRNTRRFAKRQLTWFRPDRRIVWLDASLATREIVGEILAMTGNKHGKGFTSNATHKR